MRAVFFTFLLAALGVGAVWFGARSRPEPQGAVRFSGKEFIERVETSPRVEATARESEALTRTSAALIRTEVDDTASAADAALEELRLWELDVVPLLRNESGRALTKRREWIAEFGSLYQSQRPEKAALEATKRRADTVRAALGQTTGQPFLLSARERSELERGRKEALETASRYRSARLNVARLVERARSSPLLPGGLLEEELRRIEAAR